MEANKRVKVLHTDKCEACVESRNDPVKHVYKGKRFCSDCDRKMRLGRRFVDQAQLYLRWRDRL